jgi:hypothetical protein
MSRSTAASKDTNDDHLGKQVLRNDDLDHLESDGARVADDVRARPNRHWAVAREIGASLSTSGSMNGEAEGASADLRDKSY